MRQRFRYHAPLDPECPNNPTNRPHDPMDDYCGCMDEINADAKRRHFSTCERCQAYGVRHIEVELVEL